MDKLQQQRYERAQAILRKELGPGWESIVQDIGTQNLRQRAGKDLTSFVAYPLRGKGGDNRWQGNCSPRFVEDVLKYVLGCKRYYRNDTSSFTMLDPMSGSGSSLMAADNLNVRALLYDLNPEPAHGIGGWNALRDDVEDDSDFIWLHPPYHTMIAYSGNMWGAQPHPDDLSRCGSYSEFIDKLNYVIKKLYFSLRRDGRLGILVGDLRKDGSLYSIQRDIMTLGMLEGFIVKGQYNCSSDRRTYKKPFIPVVTEYFLLMKKEGGLLVSFTRTVGGVLNMMQTENSAITWKHLVRTVFEENGGQLTSEELYRILQDHPKAKKNPHYRDRIRATVYENPSVFQVSGRGEYQLSYPVAA